MAPAPLTNPPLTGLMVVEVGQACSAPLAGVILADLGSEVIKVEKPAGGGLVSLTASVALVIWGAAIRHDMERGGFLNGAGLMPADAAQDVD